MIKPPKLIRTEILIATILRVGVIVCGVVLTLGIVMGLSHSKSHQGLSTEDLNILLQGKLLENSTIPQSPAQFSDGIKSGNAGTVMALGLLLLISLPVLRVAFTVVLFLIEKDYVYLTITFIVLSVLLSGLIFGKAL